MNQQKELDELLKNPLIASLYQINKVEMVEDFVKCYQKIRSLCGITFNDLMAEVAKELFDLRSQCKKGTGILSVALLMCSINIEEDKDKEEEHNEFIKACAVWIIMNDLDKPKY